MCLCLLVILLSSLCFSRDQDYVMEALDLELSQILIFSLIEITDSLIEKLDSGLDVKYVA